MTYSGGSVTRISRSCPTGETLAYAEYRAGAIHTYTGGSFATPNPLPEGPEAANVSCSGTISANFTWVRAFPSDEPPKSIILYQKCQADWTGTSGSCDNELGGEVVQQFQGQVLVGESQVGEKFEAMIEPGEQFTVKISPTAIGDSILPPNTVPKACSASVTYAARAWVPSIDQSGSHFLPEPEQYDSFQALVGQELRYQLNFEAVSPWDGSAVPHSLDTFEWAVPDGKILGWVSMPANQEYRENIPPDLGGEQQISLFQTKRTLQTVLVYFYVQFDDGGSHHLTAETKTLVQRPRSRFLGEVLWATGRFYEGFYWLASSRPLTYTPPNGDNPGMDDFPIVYKGRISSPVHLRDGVPAGRGELYQLTDYFADSWADPTPPVQSNGYALDNQFPYNDPDFYAPDSGWGQANTHLGEDAPTFGSGPVPMNFSVNCNFKMYFVYLPPGYANHARIHVPLGRVTWHWTGSGSRPALFAPWNWNLLLKISSTVGPDNVDIDEVQWDHKFNNY